MNHCQSGVLFIPSTNVTCHCYNAVMAFNLTVITIRQTDRKEGGVTSRMYISPECNVIFIQSLWLSRKLIIIVLYLGCCHRWHWYMSNDHSEKPAAEDRCNRFLRLQDITSQKTVILKTYILPRSFQFKVPPSNENKQDKFSRVRSFIPPWPQHSLYFCTAIVLPSTTMGSRSRVCNLTCTAVGDAQLFSAPDITATSDTTFLKIDYRTL